MASGCRRSPRLANKTQTNSALVLLLADLITTARARVNQLPRHYAEFRILDALLTHAPTAEGVEVIARDIIAASEEEDGLVQLAGLYKTGLLLPSEYLSSYPGNVIQHSVLSGLSTVRGGGNTPLVSFHPSRDSDIQSEAEAIDLELAKRDRAKLQKYVSQLILLFTRV
jgi:hypothetical protein